MTSREIIWKMTMAKAAKSIEAREPELDAQLPKPVGYRVLIALPFVEETFDGSDLIKANTTKHHEYIMSIIGIVLDMAISVTLIQKDSLWGRGVNKVIMLCFVPIQVHGLPWMGESIV